MNLLLLLLGCPRPLPPHLMVQPTEEALAAAPVTTLEEALTATLGGDPLARSPKLLPKGTLAGIEGSEPLREVGQAIRSVEQGALAVDAALRPLAWQDDRLVVPLARGYLYRRVENQLAGVVADEDARPLVTLLTPLRVTEADAALTRDPLGFLADEKARRLYGERQVLDGWLHDPDAPLGPVQAALSRPDHTRLADSPSGRLLLARGSRGDTETAWSDLERATRLALTRVAADRDKEQAAWADLLLAEREALDTEDPIGHLLERSFDGLLAGAADDDTAGAALVALAARRWEDSCPDAPCMGLDRVELLGVASRYGERAAALATVWRVIALKDALDGMEAGQDSVLFPKLVVDLTDVLHGTGARPLDASLLMKARPDAATWLSLSRAVGAETALDWGMARNALAEHGVRVVDDALAKHEDDVLQPLLARIRNRIAL